jgi:hypothetical protein
MIENKRTSKYRSSGKVVKTGGYTVSRNFCEGLHEELKRRGN